MSQIINIPLILLSIFSFIKCDIYRDRHNGYKAVYDCLGDGRGEGSGNSIQIPEDCFDESPLRKYECCYFEYYKDNGWKTGCMKIYKGDEEDLNDLKDFVSKLSTDTVFNCKQKYLEFSFYIIFIILFFLI